MSTATTTLTSGAVPDVAPVTEHPQGATWLDDLKAAKVVWKREILRFRRNRIRILTSLAQPILEPGHFAADLGGRQPQPPGRLRKAAQLRDGVELLDT